MEGGDYDAYEETPSAAACDRDCMMASLILGTICLIIVAIALASLFVAWRCYERRQTGGEMQNRQRFDIVAVSGISSVKFASNKRDIPAIDTV